MATPKLSEATRRAIECEIDRGGTNSFIARKLRVSTGTVSNVRRGMIGGTLEIEKLKRLKSSAEQDFREALKEIARLRTELDAFIAVHDYARHFRPINIQTKRGGRGEATAIVCASDWHFEEDVNKAAVNGVNEYNLEIAAKRLQRFWATAASLIDMCRTRSQIDTIVVNLMGDLINGWIHEEYLASNSLTPPEAVLAVFDQLISGFEFLLRETKVKEILVPCIHGNHGRFTKRKWSKKGTGTSYEWLLYSLLARWFEAKKNNRIRFLLPQGDMTYIKVYDRVIRVTHGDNIRYNGGLGGVHIPLRKAIDNWNTQIRADYTYLGHWHSDITGEDYRINGSVIGYNEFSIKIKARFQKPSQAFELQHPRYGATARFPMVLE